MKDSKERGAKKPGYVQKKPCWYDFVESVLGKEKKSATVGRICGSRDSNSPVIMRDAWPARAVASLHHDDHDDDHGEQHALLIHRSPSVL